MISIKTERGFKPLANQYVEKDGIFLQIKSTDKMYYNSVWHDIGEKIYPNTSSVLKIEVTDTSSLGEYFQLTEVQKSSINWGDGYEDDLNYHTYTNDGIYIIEIKNNTRLMVQNKKYEDFLLTEVLQLSNMINDASTVVASCKCLKDIIATNWDPKNLTSLELFAYRSSFLRKIDFSNVTFNMNVNIDNMFMGCSHVTEAYAKDKITCDWLNSSLHKPDTWQFVVKQITSE